MEVLVISLYMIVLSILGLYGFHRGGLKFRHPARGPVEERVCTYREGICGRRGDLG